MNKPGPGLNVGRYLFRDARWRRALWIGMTLLMIFFGLLVWGGVTLFSAASQQLPGLWESGRQAVQGLGLNLPVQIPGLPTAKTPAPDVSGEDIGPVPRMTGMVRVKYAREGAQVRVGYAGSVDYHAVLEHYARGYVERGFTRTVISASPEQEKHRYSGAGAAFDVHIQRSTDDVVQVDIVTGRG